MEELNQEQKKAVFSENKHTMVLAGAGTGKTKTIIHKVIHLIEKNQIPSKIAILTFTRKAANEVRKNYLLLSKKYLIFSINFVDLGIM